MILKVKIMWGKLKNIFFTEQSYTIIIFFKALINDDIIKQLNKWQLLNPDNLLKFWIKLQDNFYNSIFFSLIALILYVGAIYINNIWELLKWLFTYLAKFFLNTSVIISNKSTKIQSNIVCDGFSHFIKVKVMSLLLCCTKFDIKHTQK